MKCIKLSDKAGTVVNLDHVQYLSKGRDDGRLFIQLRGCYFDLKGSDEDIAIDAARIERAMLSGQVKRLLPTNKPRSGPCEVIGFIHPVLGRVRAALMLSTPKVWPCCRTIHQWLRGCWLRFARPSEKTSSSAHC